MKLYKELGDNILCTL